MRKTFSAQHPRIAMLMAAGFGTRMGNLTDELPKPLLPLNHLRIIDVLLYKLANQGIERVVVNVHYLAEMMKAHLRNGGRFGIELIISEEPLLLGSGGGIANAESYFDGETILVINADVLCDMDVRELFAYHLRWEALATMVAIPSRNNRDYGLLLFDEKKNLREFMVKKQEIPRRWQSGIFIGYQVLSPEARAYLKSEKQSIISRFYMEALKAGEPLKVMLFHGQWIDIGTEKYYYSFVDKVKSHEIDLKDFM